MKATSYLIRIYEKDDKGRGFPYAAGLLTEPQEPERIAAIGFGSSPEACVTLAAKGIRAYIRREAKKSLDKSTKT